MARANAMSKASAEPAEPRRLTAFVPRHGGWPQRPIPGADEPLVGYVGRCAADLALSSVAQLPKGDADASPDRLVSGDAIAVIAELADLEVERLARSTFIRSGDGWTLGNSGARVAPRELLTRRLRTCQGCLEQDDAVRRLSGDRSPGRHLRVWWMLDAVQACPIHARALDVVAWRPNMPPANWARGITDWNQNEIYRAAPDDEVALSRFIVARLGFLEDAETPSALSMLDLDTALRACELVGRRDLATPTDQGRGDLNHAGDLSNGDEDGGSPARHAARRHGLQLFKRHPTVVSIVLAWARRLGRPERLLTPREVLGADLHNFLASLAAQSALRAFVEPFLSAGLEVMRTAETDPLFQHAIEGRHVYEIGEASRHLGVSPKFLRKVLTRLDKASGSSPFVNDHHLSRARAIVGDLVGAADAAARLGIDRQALNLLVKRRVLAPFVSDPRERPLFLRRGLENFFRRLTSEPAERFRYVPRGLVLLPRCPLFSGRFDLVTMCGLIASKELQVAGHIDGQPGLASILVHASDLAALAGHEPLASKLVGHQSLARALRCSLAAAKTLGQKHILPELQSVTRHRGRPVPLYDKASIETFETAAISLREIKTRTSNDRWIENLKRHGVAAIHDGCRDNDAFFPRATVEELLRGIGS